MSRLNKSSTWADIQDRVRSFNFSYDVVRKNIHTLTGLWLPTAKAMSKRKNITSTECLALELYLERFITATQPNPDDEQYAGDGVEVDNGVSEY